MSNNTIYNRQAALGKVGELWRRAVLGDQQARRELLRRIMPRH